MGKVRRKAQKTKQVKPVRPDEFGFSIQQYDVTKGVEDDKKVKPKDIFEGYKSDKGKKKGKQTKNKK
jgi:hypothetical protein